MKILVIITLAFTVSACVTELDIDQQLPEQISLNGMVMEDTFSVFTLQRFNNASNPDFVNSATIWITDGQGNRVDCDGSWLTNKYVSKKHKLFGSSRYYVHCKLEDFDEFIATVEMPEKSLEIQEYTITEEYFRENDTATTPRLDLVINKKPEDGVGINRISFNINVIMSLESRRNYRCIKNNNEKEIIDCYFENGANSLSYFMRNRPWEPDTFQLMITEYNAATYEVLQKLEQIDYNENQYGALNHFIPPIQLPENVEGASGFIGGAVSNRYFFY